MRTRHVVAVAALIASTALVAVTGPGASRPPSRETHLDPADFRPVAVAAPLGPAATMTIEIDPAIGSAGVLGADEALREPARRTVPATRPLVDQPASEVGSQAKNPWRHDPDVSFYGPGFYGERTACGQKLTTSLHGVAHRTLPCGMRITFRDPASGRTITVPIVDRGPYVAGRTWDLTGATCRALSHCFTGPIEWRWARS